MSRITTDKVGGSPPASSNSIDTESCEVEGIHSLAAWKCEAEDENDCANGLAEQKTLLTRFKLLFGRTVDSLRSDICAENPAQCETTHRFRRG
ncbi:hypothetical protein CEXT_754471 [Caerostris extrusa]|uniref:Uncharacterized protein n=1 Tax=Caerostris extrusa TaxID=172846 RepID=A0AAV4UYT7_CAEEX|nr:hypothetical protein CEXT_754471 [Caerostris extrusa]